MRGRCLIVAVALVVAAPALPGAATAVAADDPPPATLTTPVLSLRRLAGPLSRHVATTRLTTRLDAVTTDASLGDARDSTCLTVQDPAGRALYSRQPDLALIPASTLKLVTTAVALAKIGPTTRLTTEVEAAAPPTAGAVDVLYLVGGGDPLLSTADFALEGGYLGQPRLATSIESLADRISAAGIRHVGRVVGDDTRYDAQRTVPTWLPRYLTNFEISPISALTVNKGFLTFKPPTAVAPSPAAYAAQVLSDLLKARGVAVDAEAAAGSAPTGPSATTITSIESPPLADVVGEILQHSDNLGAEMLLKELGARFGTGGSTASGLAVVHQYLAESGLPADDLTAADGSGLDRSDRLTCDLLQQLLVRAGEGGDLDRALPVAGGVGTLHRRFVNTPAAGRVRAKTGSLEGVVALSGWASTGGDGGSQSNAFSLLANGLPTTSAGTALQDRVATAVASYPEAPSPADLAPLPAQAAPTQPAPPP